jgi:hypothetical protein
MTSPVRQVTVKCPACGKRYVTHYRASVNLQLDDFDEEYIKEVTTGTCLHCVQKVAFDALVIDEDGDFTFHEGGEEDAT